MKDRKLIVAIFVSVSLLLSTASFAAPAPSHANKAVLQSIIKLQLPFIRNEGQIKDERVYFYATTFGGAFYVGEDGEMTYLINPPAERKTPGRTPGRFGNPEPDAGSKGWALRERLVGAGKVSPRGADPAKTKVNSFIGNDRSKWKTNMATYGTVSLGEVYKGIDLSLRASGSSVEKIFTIKPGADPGAIRLKAEGAKSLKVSDSGELLMATGLGDIRFSQPVAFQEKEGRKIDVAVAYRLEDESYAFTVGDYDRMLPLVIDPYYVVYSSFLGGTDSESGYHISVDPTGAVYVAGTIYYGGGGRDAFVSKLSPDGRTLLYFTYLGGSGTEYGRSLAVDASGNAYVAGFTESPDFPVTVGAFQTAYGGGEADAFAAKLSADGTSLIYSTFLGGASGDSAYSMTVDTSGNAYVAGLAFSTDFPVTSGAFQTSFGGGPYDAFVTKLSADGSSLIYSTFLGGTQDEWIPGITLDTSGNAYLTGPTRSIDFPVTSGAFQAAHGGGPYDAFVAKLSADGSSLIYSTFLGGALEDWGNNIAVDATGCAYVTGHTAGNFPVTSGAFQTSYGGGLADAFAAKLSADGSSLIYSTFLGGASNDYGYGIGVDASGNAYVGGPTNSTNFPVTPGAFQTSMAGWHDVFVLKLAANGASLLYSTYLGGSTDELGTITTDASGNIYVTGYTDSSNFPVRNPLQATLGGGSDAFVAKFSFDTVAPSSQLTVPQNTPEAPVGTNIEVQVSDSASGVDTSTITLQVNGNTVTPSITPSGTGGSQYTLAYDPPTDFGYTQQVTVVVTAADTAGNSATQVFSFQTEPSPNPYNPLGDEDRDGINNTWESRLGTDMTKRTLFVKPLYKQGPVSPELYWEAFKTTYLADIQAYFNSHFQDKRQVGVEIVVIGDPANPYAPMRSLSYDPATDTNPNGKPPVNIITIQARGVEQCVPNLGAFEVMTGNYGHIKIKTSFIQPDPDSPYWQDCGPAATCSTQGCLCYATWTWDTKGATTHVDNSLYDPGSNRIGYHGPVYVGLHALACYFEEGVYDSLAVNSPSCSNVTSCYPLRTSPCCSPTKWSVDDYNHNGLVDFSEYTVNGTTGAIIGVGNTNISGQEYDRVTALKHTLVHEIMHALLRASGAVDECANPCCPMGGHVARERGWTLTYPGASSCGSVSGFSCTHGTAGDANDITAPGVIYNVSH